MQLIRHRQPRPGPENALINRFLEHFPLTPVGSRRLTVFQEPQLTSGLPDLVAALWDEPTAMRWTTTRAVLPTQAVRLAHLMLLLGAQTAEQLSTVFQRRVDKLLKHLRDAEVITERKGRWSVVPPRTSFAVRRLVAFEAKISDWRGAIEQAALNRWFACESYVLLPHPPRISDTLVLAAQANVGVWIVGQRRPLLPSRIETGRQPMSYASWLFNEWVWRHALTATAPSKETPDGYDGLGSEPVSGAIGDYRIPSRRSEVGVRGDTCPGRSRCDQVDQARHECRPCAA